MKRLLFITIALVLTGVLPKSRTAVACSGGGYQVSLDRVLQITDHLVKATIVETDGYNMNAILKVESYLTGGAGPEFILLNQLPEAANEENWRDFFYYCMGTGISELKPGITAYFGVQRRPDGSYGYSDPYYGGTMVGVRAYSAEGGNYGWHQIDPALGEDYPNYRELILDSDAEFEALVAELTGETAVPPNRPPGQYDEFEVDYVPRHNPLLITTEHGTQYLLPVDRTDQVVRLDEVWQVEHWSPNAYPALFETPCFCAEAPCRLYAPNRDLYASLVNPYTVAIDDTTLSGQAFAFSSTGHVLTVEDSGTLDFYLLTTGEYNADGHYYHTNVRLIHSVSYKSGSQGSITSLLTNVRWSGDGTTVTYADWRGVWVWDIYHQAHPELVAEAPLGQLYRPLFLSQSGRYVGYATQPDQLDWLTLDRMTGSTYENVIYSPDEHFMLQIAPPVYLEIANFDGCYPPLAAECRLVLLDRPRFAGWVNDTDLYWVLCLDATSCRFTGRRMGIEPQGSQERELFYGYASNVTDLAFEPDQEMFATVVGPTDLEVDYEGYSLQGQIDGTIVDIEWLPALYFGK